MFKNTCILQWKMIFYFNRSKCESWGWDERIYVALIKRLLIKCLLNKCLLIKWLLIKCSLIKCPLIKCSLIKCSLIKCSLIKCSLIKCSLIRCSQNKCFLIKCFLIKCFLTSATPSTFKITTSIYRMGGHKTVTYQKYSFIQWSIFLRKVKHSINIVISL